MMPLFPFSVFFAWAAYLSWTHKNGAPLYPIWITVGCFSPISAYQKYLQYQGQAISDDQHDALFSLMVGLIVSLELTKWFQLRNRNAQPDTSPSEDDSKTPKRTGWHAILWGSGSG